MDAHSREYLAAAEAVGGPFPAIGSVVWFDYGSGVSSGRVLGMVDTPDGLAVRCQRSQSEILEIVLDRLQAPPRFFETPPGARPAVGMLVWFTAAGGGQLRGVVEQESPDGGSYLVRLSESGEVVEVPASSILTF